MKPEPIAEGAFSRVLREDEEDPIVTYYGQPARTSTVMQLESDKLLYGNAFAVAREGHLLERIVPHHVRAFHVKTPQLKTPTRAAFERLTAAAEARIDQPTVKPTRPDDYDRWIATIVELVNATEHAREILGEPEPPTGG